MLDTALLRDRFDLVSERLRTRGPGLEPLLERLAAFDRERRTLIPRVETLKRERNEAGEEIAKLKRQGGDASALLEANKKRAEEIKGLDADLAMLDAKREDALLRVPNIPHESVPVGAGPADNVEIRRHGEPREVRQRQLREESGESALPPGKADGAQSREQPRGGQHGEHL